MPRWFDGVIKGSHNVLLAFTRTIREKGFYVGEIFGYCFARYGHLVAIDEVGVEEEFHHCGCSADVVKLFHDVTPRGFEITQDGCFVGYVLKFVNVEVYVISSGNGEQVEHDIGGAARDNGEADGVEE